MSIAPADAAVAARSFPRRWRGVFALATGDDGGGDDVLARSGAVGLADEAARLLADTAARLPGTVTPSAGGGTDALDRLALAAEGLATVVESVPADDWAGGAIDTLTSAIDGAAALLRRAERAVEEARRAPR